MEELPDWMPTGAREIAHRQFRAALAREQVQRFAQQAPARTGRIADATGGDLRCAGDGAV